MARPGLAAGNVNDLIRLARAEPGKLTYASSSTGTPYHMAGELFKSRAGVDILHVPYKSSGGARTDVLGGQVDLMFDAMTPDQFSRFLLQDIDKWSRLAASTSINVEQ